MSSPNGVSSAGSPACAPRRRPSLSPATRTSASPRCSNTLTGAEASIDDRLFETLDPTTRSFEHEGRRYLLTDTVGFIRRLPHELVEGFAATLEETLIADLVLHVVDASADEMPRSTRWCRPSRRCCRRSGRASCRSSSCSTRSTGVDDEARERLENRFPGSLQVSAETGEGLDALRARVAERFEGRFQVVELLVPYERGDVVSSLYALGPPIELREDRADGVFIRARLPERELRRLAPFLVRDAVAAS